MALTAMPTGDLYSSAVIGYVNSANLPPGSSIQSIQIQEHLPKVSEHLPKVSDTEIVGVVPPETISNTHRSYHHHTPYQRRTLLSVSPKKLHYRRGISRGGDNYHRPGLHIADNDFIPQEFRDSVNDAISQYGTESGRSSPTTDQFLETSNNHWTANLTGNTTDRSSTNSTVTYDDFDKEASLNVQKLFNGIDSMLFESESDSSASQLYDECRDWSAAFPHFRILGNQLLQSSEQGYQMVESRLSHTLSSSSDTLDTEHRTNSYLDSPTSFSSDTSGLAVEGIRVRTHIYSATPTSTSDTYQSTPDMTDISEEIFVLDGYYEDIIAIDSDLHEDPLDSKTIAASQRQRRSRYPPVTPNACAKDGIVHSVFDVLWTLLTDAMRVLLQRYSECFVITHPMAIEAPEESDHEDGHVKLPQILKHNSRLDSMHMAHGGHRLISGSVLSRPNNPFAALSSHNSNDHLMKILQISKMEMSDRREKTFLEEGTETPVGMLMGPTSAMKKSNGGRNTSASRRPMGPMRSKLVPLNDSRVRTPNVDDEVLRGQGITAVGKRLSSPPMMGSRMLPPINHSDMAAPPLGHMETTPPQTRGIQKRGNRASSAIAEKDTRANLREKVAIITETRPSTTHTVYQTDQSGMLHMGLSAQHRSSTPMDRTSTKLRNDLPLGITGSSLIGQHAALDEEVEGRYETIPHHSQWAPPHTATAGYRRGNKPLNSFVR